MTDQHYPPYLPYSDDWNPTGGLVDVPKSDLPPPAQDVAWRTSDDTVQD